MARLPGTIRIECGWLFLTTSGRHGAGFPSQKQNPDTSQPYVMWGGTPYEHLMILVE